MRKNKPWFVKNCSDIVHDKEMTPVDLEVMKAKGRGIAQFCVNNIFRSSKSLSVNAGMDIAIDLYDLCLDM